MGRKPHMCTLLLQGSRHSTMPSCQQPGPTSGSAHIHGLSPGWRQPAPHTPGAARLHPCRPRAWQGGQGARLCCALRLHQAGRPSLITHQQHCAARNWAAAALLRAAQATTPWGTSTAPGHVTHMAGVSEAPMGGRELSHAQHPLIARAYTRHTWCMGQSGQGPPRTPATGTTPTPPTQRYSCSTHPLLRCWLRPRTCPPAAECCCL